MDHGFTLFHHITHSHGMIENRNKEIGKMLRLLIEDEKEWDECLPSVLWALRTTKNSLNSAVLNFYMDERIHALWK